MVSADATDATVPAVPARVAGPATSHLSHGANTQRVFDPLAGSLLAELLDARPDLARFPDAVAAWARAEARALLLDRWNSEHGLLDSRGKPSPAAEFADRIEKSAARARAELGLTPGSEARLARDRAAAVTISTDLSQLLAQGRSLLAGGDGTTTTTATDSTATDAPTPPGLGAGDDLSARGRVAALVGGTPTNSAPGNYDDAEPDPDLDSEGPEVVDAAGRALDALRDDTRRMNAAKTSTRGTSR